MAMESVGYIKPNDNSPIWTFVVISNKTRYEIGLLLHGFHICLPIALL